MSRAQGAQSVTLRERVAAARAVTLVTNTAGGAVRPVSPQVADTVTATGQQVGATVDKVGRTVGGQ